MKYLDAAQYVLDNQDAIVEQLANGDELAEQLIDAYDAFYDKPSDERAQRALVQAVVAYKEAMGQ